MRYEGSRTMVWQELIQLSYKVSSHDTAEWVWSSNQGMAWPSSFVGHTSKFLMHWLIHVVHWLINALAYQMHWLTILWQSYSCGTCSPTLARHITPISLLGVHFDIREDCHVEVDKPRWMWCSTREARHVARVIQILTNDVYHENKLRSPTSSSLLFSSLGPIFVEEGKDVLWLYCQ